MSTYITRKLDHFFRITKSCVNQSEMMCVFVPATESEAALVHFRHGNKRVERNQDKMNNVFYTDKRTVG